MHITLLKIMKQRNSTEKYKLQNQKTVGIPGFMLTSAS